MQAIEVEELALLHEQSSADPDQPLTNHERDMLLSCALSGAAVGLRERGPVLISIDADFLRRLESCTH